MDFELDELSKDELIDFILGCHTYNMSPNEYIIYLIDKIIAQDKSISEGKALREKFIL